MKRVVLTIAIVLGFAMQSWGQEKETSKIEQNVEEIKTELNNIEKTTERIKDLIKPFDKEDDKLPQFNIITKAEVKDGVLYVNGFEKVYGKFVKKKQSMEKKNVYTNRIRKVFPNATFSLMTVPFKIRSKTDDVSRKTYSDLKNVSVNLDLLSYQWDRYFASGKTSTHRISGGIFFNPLVEELTAENTINPTENGNQLFISTGLSVNYSYNKLTFTVIPAGFDIATNSAGKKWVYNGKYWWGFGIGVDLKILEGIFE